MLLQHNDHSTVRNVRLKNLFSRTCCRNSPSVRLVNSLRLWHNDIDPFTHRRFYTRTLSHTDAFTHRPFYTQTPLNTDTFTPRPFYTQCHRAFTQRHFYTQTMITIMITMVMQDQSSIIFVICFCHRHQYQHHYYCIRKPKTLSSLIIIFLIIVCSLFRQTNSYTNSTRQPCCRPSATRQRAGRMPEAVKVKTLQKLICKQRALVRFPFPCPSHFRSEMLPTNRRFPTKMLADKHPARFGSLRERCSHCCIPGAAMLLTNGFKL